MRELTAESLVREADNLLNEQERLQDAVWLYRAAAVLYRNNNQLNLAVASLIKIGVGLQDYSNYYNIVIDAYQEAAELQEQFGNREGCYSSLFSAAFVAQKKGDNELAIRLFTNAAFGYQEVAEEYWEQNQPRIAWDNLQLSLRCWRQALECTGTNIQSQEK